MDGDLACEAACSRDKLVRYTARGRHYSPAARLAIVEESYATGARVADTAALYGISRSQLHAWRKKYDGRDEAGDDCREIVSFAPVVIAAPVSEAEPPAVSTQPRPDFQFTRLLMATHQTFLAQTPIFAPALRQTLHIAGGPALSRLMLRRRGTAGLLSARTGRRERALRRCGLLPVWWTPR
jgi:transposase-like protein